MRKNQVNYSQSIFCSQLHALYDLLQKRQQEILADPDFNPGNDELNDELEEIFFKLKLLQDCFEKFCPG